MLGSTVEVIGGCCRSTLALSGVLRGARLARLRSGVLPGPRLIRPWVLGATPPCFASCPAPLAALGPWIRLSTTLLVQSLQGSFWAFASHSFHLLMYGDIHRKADALLCQIKYYFTNILNNAICRILAQSTVVCCNIAIRNIHGYKNCNYRR